MKRINLKFALLTLCVAFTFTTKAQYFDWAKSFNGHGDEYTSVPRGLVSDTAGNIYYLMQCKQGGMLDTINPFAGITNYNLSTLLVKMSPQGDYLWLRILNPWEGVNESQAQPWALRMVGDTALMMMATFKLPRTMYYSGYNHVLSKLFYLDTLLTTNDMLMPVDSIATDRVTAFITLGLDGTLKENHFLQVSWLDSKGNPVRGLNNMSQLATDILSNESFDIDSRGNIYVVRRSYDVPLQHCDTCASGLRYWDFENGDLSSQRIVVDGTRFLTHTPAYPTSYLNQQVLKFSPHFDSLLDASYVINDPMRSDVVNEMISLNSFDIYDDQLYLTLTYHPVHDSMLISRSSGLRLFADSLCEGFGTSCLLRLDTTLTPDLLMQFSFLPHPMGITSSVGLTATCIDTASNSLFVLGGSGTEAFTGNNGRQQIVYRDDTLSLRNDAFWLRVNLQTGDFLSYGRTNSAVGGVISGMSIAARDNRVFAQVSYWNSINFADTVINLRGSNSGLALAQWDYDGHQVKLYDYQLPADYSHIAGHLVMQDTSVYVTGTCFSSPTFGSNFPGMGQYAARLVDTSLRSPYIFNITPADQTIVWSVDDTLRITRPYADFALPLHATTTSGLPVYYQTSDSSVAYVTTVVEGDQVWAVCQRGICQITATQPGNSYWNAAPPITKTLIVGPQYQQYMLWDQPLDFTLTDSPVPITAVTTAGFNDINLNFELTDTISWPWHYPIEYNWDSHLLILHDTGTFVVRAYHSGIEGLYNYCDTTRILTVRPAPVGIEEISTLNSQPSIYPNPTFGKVTVTSPEHLASATLTDMQGRCEEVKLTAIGNGQYSLDLTTTPQGVYLITLTTADSKTYTTRLLKQPDIFGK